MKIHSILHGSRANGPGLRTVIWFRGCLLACHGCQNRATWNFDGGIETSPRALADQIISGCLPGTTGITVSGGEPMHQAASLLGLFLELRERRPEWSLGLFTGYTWSELTQAEYDLRELMLPERFKPILWQNLYPMLDFVKLGRWRSNLPPSDKPLCSSANQDLILPTGRYSMADFRENVQEFNFEADGMVTITGFPVRRA